MGRLEFSLKAIEDANKVTKRMRLIFCLMMFTLNYEHVSAVESVPDGSYENPSIFEVEIQGTLEVAIELNLKMHMVC